ncbi:hypothetical protein A2716_01830 [candidate division WWE3 bacterium RIFCSPHIGHO2_01_FULL_40_23]|uniref:Uncharacterized protein n=1 Tax=candidate division WWE3 bacterium RIFCSPLOWO2_01_FULL_41_18 TaxID=1802625 RepID=A0A1F4VEZ4_UNCKA|nr:MAG: hypothetical protein A2716_01830 [candidate division WWE3 bacterium RIFCSPHIGHO2_01_FULL_40_23]OGC55729.1 MAG: hypothetical protein A3A78_01680 [candidate division WWE3 bacterium RIFCSPLOWO2_01_FULL_41_18]
MSSSSQKSRLRVMGVDKGKGGKYPAYLIVAVVFVSLLALVGLLTYGRGNLLHSIVLVAAFAIVILAGHTVFMLSSYAVTSFLLALRRSGKRKR